MNTDNIIKKTKKEIIDKISKKMGIDIKYSDYDELNYCKLKIYTIEDDGIISLKIGMFYKKQDAEKYIKLLKKQIPSIYKKNFRVVSDIKYVNWVSFVVFAADQGLIDK